MKLSKAPGLDVFLMECLMKGGMAVLELASESLLNISFDILVVCMDCCCASIVPHVQRKGCQI